jgi:pyrroloquinoline quinone biosynthesis protein D
MKQLPEMPRLNRRFRMQWEQVQHANVLLYPEGMVRLNRSAAEILQCCNGATTVDDIVAQLERKFNASGLRNDIVDLLAHALEKDWIQ